MIEKNRLTKMVDLVFRQVRFPKNNKKKVIFISR